MAANDTPLITARRNRLQAWIDAKHDGKQVSFRKIGKMNQGMLSDLLKPHGKPFGEKQAAKLEALHKMPEGYLVNAQAPVDAGALRVESPMVAYDPGAEIDATQYVMGAMFAVMARHRPAEAEELHAELMRLPASLQEGRLVQAVLSALEPKRKVSRARQPSRPA